MVAKERITLMVCTNSDGTHKLPPVAIGKSAKPQCFRDAPNGSPPIPYKSQKNAWMDSETAQHWFDECFRPEVESIHGSDPILLIWDNAPPHVHVESTSPSIEIKLLPENLTSVYQPMDQGVIAALKVRSMNVHDFYQ